jgi:predicted lipid-binding transport protein (Tim44 family)
LKAEKKFDRYQSATVAAIEGRTLGVDQSRPGSPANGTPQRQQPPTSGGGKGKEPSDNNTDASMEEDSKQQQQREVDETQVAAEAVAQALGGEVEELRDLVVRRAQELEELRNERRSLKMEIDSLKVKVRLSDI